MKKGNLQNKIKKIEERFDLYRGDESGVYYGKDTYGAPNFVPSQALEDIKHFYRKEITELLEEEKISFSLSEYKKLLKHERNKWFNYGGEEERKRVRKEIIPHFELLIKWLKKEYPDSSKKLDEVLQI